MRLKCKVCGVFCEVRATIDIELPCLLGAHPPKWEKIESVSNAEIDKTFDNVKKSIEKLQSSFTQE